MPVNEVSILAALVMVWRVLKSVNTRLNRFLCQKNANKKIISNNDC